jgi:hypothetical protein
VSVFASGSRPQSTGRGGLPCAASRKAGWASAWWPGPAEKRPGAREWIARAERARSAVAARSLLARRRDSALVGGSPVTRFGRGAPGGFPRGRWRKEGTVGSPRRRLDRWGQSGGDVTVLMDDGGALAISEGRPELLQHRPQRGGEGRREI